MPDPTSADTVVLAAALTEAWLGNPHTRPSSDDVPAFLRSMHAALLGLSGSDDAPEAEPPSYTPAVTARRSLASADHILSMIDGKPYKTLKRHLKNHGLTPDQYRERYGLKPDYPMVASAYSEARRAMAKTIGLGRKAGTKVEKKVEQVAETATKTVRKSGKAALAAAKKALGGES